jgi:hypothetical protein
MEALARAIGSHAPKGYPSFNNEQFRQGWGAVDRPFVDSSPTV